MPNYQHIRLKRLKARTVLIKQQQTKHDKKNYILCRNNRKQFTPRQDRNS